MEHLKHLGQSPTLIATSAATLIIGAVYSYHWYLSHQRSGEVPIQWSWIPLLGDAIELGTRPLDFLTERAKTNKDIFGMVVAGNRMFLISDPHSQHIVLKHTKSFSFEAFQNLIMENFFGSDFKKAGVHGLSDFDEDLMRKWFSTYLLSNSALVTLTQRMQVQLDKDIAAHKSTRPVPLYNFLAKIIFQASVASLFNGAAGDDHALFDAFEKFDQHLPMAAGGYKVSYTSVPRKARQILLDAVSKYLGSDNSEFIRKRTEYFKGFDNGSLTPSFQLAMLWASVGNTMPATFWLLFFLLSNPVTLETLMKQIKEVCGDSPDGEISQESLDKLVYLDCCLTESLRMSSGSIIMRMVLEPTDITLASGKRYKFRKGDRVGLCPPLWHRDAEIYPEPFVYKPERWMLGEEASAEDVAAASVGRIPMSKGGKALPNGAAYMPFGGGYTHCPGRRFARNEVKTAVVFLLTRFQLSFASEDGKAPAHPGFDGARAGLGIFPPKDDVNVFISKR